MEEEKKERTQQKQNHIVKWKRKWLWRSVFVVLLVAAVGALGFSVYFRLFRVQPVFTSIVYELGEKVSRNLEDYLRGPAWAVEQGKLDLSQVDEDHVGTYQASVSRGRAEYLYEIIIEDTVPPDITPREELVYLAVCREYSAEELVSGVADKDSQVTLYIQKEAQLQETVAFDTPGSFTCIVIAEDSSGNRNAVSVPVVVDTPPEISGVRNIYLAMGREVDYLEKVTAWDETDGNLTDRITVDDSQVQLTQEGTYRLAYQVEDDLGIETVIYADVTVASAEALQEMIGSRQISRKGAWIIGAANLYDAGASEHDDIDETLEYMKPALVQLYHGDIYSYSAGSGYLMEITEDTIYICSNRHVVEESNSWDVYFFDGTRVTGMALGCSDGYDVGVVTVAVKDVPERLFEQLMTIHIDKKYWSGLDDHRIDVGLERVDRQGGILYTSMGTLLKIKQYFAWYDNKDHTEVTLKLEHGDSGSAILDGYGNLIGMAYAYSVSPRRYWCVPLDEILDCYEEITGRKVFVY